MKSIYTHSRFIFQSLIDLQPYSRLLYPLMESLFQNFHTNQFYNKIYAHLYHLILYNFIQNLINIFISISGAVYWYINFYKLL